MKFTSEDLMKAMGLQVGYKIKIDLGYTFEIVQNGKIISLERLGEGYYTDLEFLVDTDFEILPKPKRVGELKCDGKCPLCPCIYVCNEEVNAIDKTLYEVLELGIATFTKTPKKLNEEIHNVIKARLDKEVVGE